MTVITTILARYCTVHATDSLITRLEDGRRVPIEVKRSKIVAVPQWRGAMSYWGFASYEGYKWSTVDWLAQKVMDDHSSRSAEEFANKIAEGLNENLSKMKFERPTDAGIGIHFSVYELIDGRWVPELILISNWADETYTSLRTTGVGASPQTYSSLKSMDYKPEHGDIPDRLYVQEFLSAGQFLVYNNGDPQLFNSAANGIFRMINVMESRKNLKAFNQVETYLNLVLRPIEVVSKVQHDFCKEGTRIVGGRLHNMAITPSGEYHSTTGDC